MCVLHLLSLFWPLLQAPYFARQCSYADRRGGWQPRTNWARNNILHLYRAPAFRRIMSPARLPQYYGHSRKRARIGCSSMRDQDGAKTFVYIERFTQKSVGSLRGSGMGIF